MQADCRKWGFSESCDIALNPSGLALAHPLMTVVSDLMGATSPTTEASNGHTSPGISQDGNIKTSQSPQHSPIRPNESRGRNYSRDSGHGASPLSAEGSLEERDDRVGVKRACNECRQQKVSKARIYPSREI